MGMFNKDTSYEQKTVVKDTDYEVPEKYEDYTIKDYIELVNRLEQKAELHVQSIAKLCTENEMLWVQDTKRKAELEEKNKVLRFYSNDKNYEDDKKGFNAVKVDSGMKAKLVLDVYGLNIDGIEQHDSIANKIRKR